MRLQRDDLLDIDQLRLPLDARPKQHRLAPWEVDIATEAAHMLREEQKHIDQVRVRFQDKIINALAGPSDKVTYSDQPEGLIVFVNGKKRGQFMRDREGLVWRVA